MRKNRNDFYLIILCISLFLISGCWNYREVNKLNIVAGVAIDKGEGNSYQLTAELVNYEMGGKEIKMHPKLITSNGETIFDAIRNMIKISSKKLYWGHAKACIISEDIAKEGIEPILDWIFRDQEPRNELLLLVAKGVKAKDIITQKQQTTELRSFQIDDGLASQASLAKAPQIHVYEFINLLSGEGISAVLPEVSLASEQQEPSINISGTALFKRDKLVGYLNGDETKDFLFIVDKIKSTLLVAKEGSTSNKPNITLEVYGNKSTFNPKYTNGKLEMDIKIKPTVTIGEMGTTQDFIEEKGRRKLIKDVEKNMQARLEKLIKKVQKEYKADIFGFGKEFNERKPSLWKRLSPQWQKEFSNVKTKVSVEINVINSALTSKPLKIGD